MCTNYLQKKYLEQFKGQVIAMFVFSTTNWVSFENYPASHQCRVEHFTGNFLFLNYKFKEWITLTDQLESDNFSLCSLQRQTDVPVLRDLVQRFYLTLLHFKNIYQTTLSEL